MKIQSTVVTLVSIACISFLSSCSLAHKANVDYSIGELDYNAQKSKLISSIVKETPEGWGVNKACLTPPYKKENDKSNDAKKLTPIKKDDQSTVKSNADSSSQTQQDGKSSSHTQDAAANDKSTVDNQTVEGAVVAISKDQCAIERNQVIGDLMVQSDELCIEHLRSIFGNEAITNIFLGSVSNALSGIGTVVTGPLSKSILSASSLFVSSERSLVNETVYKSAVVPAVVKKITDTRSALSLEIKNKLDSTIDKYPIVIAATDIIAYHQSCSFMFGLQKALEEGTRDTRQQRIGLLEQRLKLIKVDLDELKNKGDDESTKQMRSKLAERFNAISDEMKKEELLLK